MKVLIVSKTRRGSRACVGGITFDGKRDDEDDHKSVRLVAINEATDEQAGMEYAVGQVWDVKAKPAKERTPPHVEDIIVGAKRRRGHFFSPVSFIEEQMPPRRGGVNALFDGLTQPTDRGALYIAERTGIPPYSTMFWRPDQPLRRDDDGKRIRYRYPTADGRYVNGPTLTFVGFQEPLKVIPAGMLLRVSLARWWRPDDMPDGELRCYVQLSGWFLEKREHPLKKAGTQRAARGFDQAQPNEGAEDRRDISRVPLAHSPEMLRGYKTDASTASPHNRGSLSLDAPVLDSHALDSHNTPPVESPTMAEARHLLKTVFGYDTFRPLQAEIIANLLNSRDTLVIMPTGGGKSLCYQLPALIFDGLTVVVSPLIALMQDQVTQLRELGIAAAFLNSTLDFRSYTAIARQVKQGDIKLLYVAPETLLRSETLVMLDQSNVACLTIDEAHCISSWGHDFRPEYRQLMPVRQRYPDAVSIALTATATPRVQQDIKGSLGVTDSDEFVASFDRPNLFLEVQPRTDGNSQVLAFLDNHRDQSGIIYCSTRRQVDSLAALLIQRGWPALPYHAGLDARTRRENQASFVRDDAPIMVATIAFGMGIDKSNVRFIIHYNLPKNIESYYQQIGRSGRDGLRADCLLLFSGADVGTIYHFIDEGAESERAGNIARLQAMERYATIFTCRRGPLLTYFGETPASDTCEACDNCLTDGDDLETIDVTIAAQKFLSCVKRTGEIFGVSHVIQVLRGSANKKVLARGHDRLSTYGIGMEFSTREWKRLAQHFIQQGLLKQDMEYGGVSLTPQAWEVLRGNKKVLVVTQPAPQEAGLAAATHDGVLFEMLRQLRKTLADQEHLPPYMVFSDRALVEMAAYFPQSVPAFMAINGVGQVKMQKYGQRFLTFILAYCQEHGIEERAKPAISLPITPTIRGTKRRFEEVGELFADGHSVAELQEIYNVKRGTIVGHLSTYLQAGYAVDAERVLAASGLSPERQAAVLTTLTELGATALRPIFDAFNEAVPYDELHIMRLYYLCAADSSS